MASSPCLGCNDLLCGERDLTNREYFTEKIDAFKAKFSVPPCDPDCHGRCNVPGPTRPGVYGFGHATMLKARLVARQTAPWIPTSKLQKFKLFAKLPGELRMKIWKTYLNTPIIIPMTHMSEKWERNGKRMFWSSQRNGGALLLVNREAHHEAQYLLWGRFRYSEVKIGLIRWRVDIIYLADTVTQFRFRMMALSKAFRDPRKCPRKVAMNLKDIGEGSTVSRNDITFHFGQLENLCVLEEVIIVVEPCGRREQSAFVQRFSELRGDIDPRGIKAKLARRFDRMARASRYSGPLRWNRPKITLVEPRQGC